MRLKVSQTARSSTTFPPANLPNSGYKQRLEAAAQCRLYGVYSMPVFAPDLSPTLARRASCPCP